MVSHPTESYHGTRDERRRSREANLFYVVFPLTIQGTILAVGLNLRLHTRRCPQDRDEDVRAPGESYCADAAPFSMCRLVHCFLLRFALAAPSQRAVQSILPTENTRTDTSAKTAAEDVLDRSKAPSKDVLDCSKADKDTTLPLVSLCWYVIPAGQKAEMFLFYENSILQHAA